MSFVVLCLYTFVAIGYEERLQKTYLVSSGPLKGKTSTNQSSDLLAYVYVFFRPVDYRCRRHSNCCLRYHSHHRCRLLVPVGSLIIHVDYVDYAC